MARPTPTVTLRHQRTADDEPARGFGRGLPRLLRAAFTGPWRLTVIGLMLLAAGVIVAGLAALQSSPHTTAATAPATTSATTPDRGSPSTPAPAAPPSAAKPSATPTLPSTPAAPSRTSLAPAVATPVVAPFATGTTVIRVQTGDTLWVLAHRYRTTVPVLQALNGLGSSTRIATGQPRRIPANAGQLRTPATATPTASGPAVVPPAPEVRATPSANTATASAPPTVASAASPRPAHHHNRCRDQRGGRHHITTRISSAGPSHSHHLLPQGGTTAMTQHARPHDRRTQPTTHKKGHR